MDDGIDMAEDKQQRISELEQVALAVIDHHRRQTIQSVTTGGWTANRFATGFNGVVWRARSSRGEEVAVKLSLVDSRRRGQREFSATRRLADEGVDAAAVPLALVEDADLTALVSSWCPGSPLASLPRADSPTWSRVVATYVAVHGCSCSGLETAVDGATISQFLDVAETRAVYASRTAFLPVLRELRRRLDRPYSDRCTKALTHGDTGFANWLVDGDEVRLVDWEYAGVGDPCADMAGICTHPSHLDLDETTRTRLILEHAVALGSEELVERTLAFVLALLGIWCARTGVANLYPRLPGAVGTPLFTENERVDHYRDRLCQALEIDRSELDRALQITR